MDAIPLVMRLKGKRKVNQSISSTFYQSVLLSAGYPLQGTHWKLLPLLLALDPPHQISLPLLSIPGTKGKEFTNLSAQPSVGDHHQWKTHLSPHLLVQPICLKSSSLLQIPVQPQRRKTISG